MKIGTCCSAVAIVTTLIVVTGCDAGEIDFDSDPYFIGDEGNLRFWITEGCGFDDTCSPEVGLPLNADEVGVDPEVFAVANSEAIPAESLPDLVFSSSRPDRFTVRTVECFVRPDRVPCPADSTTSYIVTLDLHSEGGADLVARLADDDSLYDRGAVRVGPPE